MLTGKHSNLKKLLLKTKKTNPVSFLSSFVSVYHLSARLKKMFPRKVSVCFALSD